MAIVQYKSKGLDRRTPDYGRAFGFPHTQTNMRIYNGAFKFISGKFKTNSSALNSGAVIRGATSWFDPSNSYEAVIAVAGSKIYTAQWNSDTSALTYTERTGATTIADANFKTFASLNSLLIIAGGSVSSNVLLKMSSTTSNASNLAGSPPDGDCVIVVNNFLFVGRRRGSSTTYSRVSWSNVNDPETWSATDFVDFRKNDGDEITALSSVGTDLLIFKNQSIGRLSTTGIAVSGSYTMGPLVTISDTIGCPSALAVDTLPDGTVVFIGTDGNLYWCDGNIVKNLSETGSPGPNYAFTYSTYDPSTLSSYFLKVYPTYNEVRIKGGIVYNYLERYWYTDSVNSTENCLFNVGPRRTGGAFNAFAMCAGTSDGFILTYDNPNYTFPTDVAGVVTTSTLTMVISVRELGFIPKFMRVYFWNTILPATTTASFSWDRGASRSVSISTPGASDGTIQWPIPDYHDARNKFPTLFTAQLSGSISSGANGGFVVYFMDEDET